MAKANIKIPNLISGERYRIVISPSDDSLVSFNAPSIAFTVPPSPDRLDNPSYQLKKTNTQSLVVADTVITNGTITTSYPAVTTSGTISAWSSAVGSYNYDFTINSTSTIKVGDHFIVDNISSPPTEYYDQLRYTVTGVPSSTKVQCSARYDPNFRNFIVNGVATNTGIWAYNDGRALDNRTNKANAAQWTNITPAYSTTTPTSSGTTVFGRQTNLSMPSMPKNLIWTNTVRDVIIFMFQYNGEFYYLNNTPIAEVSDKKIMFGSTPNDTLVKAAKVSPESLIRYDTTSLPISQTSPTATAVHYLGLGSIQPKYYFTVARYILDSNGTNWNGQWLQKKVGFDANQTMDYVLKSVAV